MKFHNYSELQALTHDLEPIEQYHKGVITRVDFKRVQMVRLAKEAKK